MHARNCNTRFFLLFLLPSVGFALDLTTNDGRTYQGVEIVKVEEYGLRVAHSGGSRVLRFDDLPPGIQVQYGWTPEKSAAFKAKEAARMAAGLEQLLRANEELKRREARRAVTGSATNSPAKTEK